MVHLRLSQRAEILRRIGLQPPDRRLPEWPMVEEAAVQVVALLLVLSRAPSVGLCARENGQAYARKP